MEDEDEDRFLAVCVDCGAVFAGQTVSSGDVQAIGCREGCASCGSTEFAPVSAAPGEGASGVASADD